MKTPRFILAAALFAAPAAQAQVVAPARCDAPWLTRTVDAVAKGEVMNYNDDRIDATSSRYQLKLGSVKTCDASTWKLIAVSDVNPVVWRNPVVKTWWTTNSALAQQIGLILAVNDTYAVIDEKGLAIVAAADEAIEAAAGLGLVTAPPAEKPLSETIKGGSGGKIGALKPRVVTVLAADKRTAATVAPGEVGAAYRKLMNDGGGARTIGSSILNFRKAVLALGGELDRLSKSMDIIKKNTSRSGNTETVLRDLVTTLPAGFTPLPAVDSNAMDDAKYGGALTALVGTGADAGMDDPAPRTGAALDTIDVGLRNLILQRSKQLDAIFAATKDRLKDKTILQVETQAKAVGGTKVPATSLAGQSLARLTGGADYAGLQALYEASVKRDGANLTPQTKELGDRLTAMRTAAESAEVTEVGGKKVVVFTDLSGQKRQIPDVPGESIGTDPKLMSRVSSHIAETILWESKLDGKLDALAAALRGGGQPGGNLDARTNLAGSVPPVPPGATADTPWDKARKSSQAGCGSPSDLGKSEMERIAARKAEAAADAASDSSKLRGRLQTELNRSDADIQKKCASNTAGISPDFGAPGTPSYDAQCTALKQKARDAIWAKPEYANVVTSTAETATRTEALTKADQDIADLYDSGIASALAQLETAYAKKGDKHRLDLERATGYRDATFSTERVKQYFDNAWRGKDKDAAFAACREKFGYKKGADLRKTPLQNPRADREQDVEGSVGVNEDCGVRAGIVTYFRSFKGSVGLVDPAGVKPVDPVTPGNLDSEIERRRKPKGQ